MSTQRATNHQELEERCAALEAALEATRLELAQARMFNRSLLDSIDDAISIVDPKTFEIVDVNRAFLNSHAITRERALGRTCFDVTHGLSSPCQAPEHPCPLVETLADGRYCGADHKHLRSDDQFHVKVSTAPLRGLDGEITRIIHVARDTSEWRATEELASLQRIKILEQQVEIATEQAAARDSEVRYHSIFETAGTSMLLVDARLVISKVNHEFERLTGYSREEVEGVLHWSALFDEESVARISETTRQEPTSSTSCNVNLLDREGNPHYGIITVRFVPGTAIRVASFMDITELEEARKFAELQEAQLRQADRLATLGTLVSGMAHEINNPNNFISLNSKILSRMWLDIGPILAERFESDGDFPLAGIPYSRAHERVGLLLEGLTEGSERINRIVDALKDFSRRDTGKLNEPVQLGRVLDSALLILANMLKNSTQALSVRCDPDLPVILGSTQQLEQVVLNLLANACQALRDPREAIRVTMGALPDEEVLSLVVEDDGVGIAPEALSQVLDPFFTTKRGHGGTGLGLSISNNIVRNHGGSLKIESTPGQGTRVEVRLPMASTIEEEHE